MMTLHKQQRHGGNRGAGNNHRGLDATSAFYAGAVATQAVIPITPITATATRLPPYGHDVEQAVAAGKNPNVFLFATSDAWDRARKRTRGTALVLPPGDDPEVYRWPCVPSGVFVCAPGASRELAFRLARAVVSGGTQLAFAVFGDGEALIVRTSAHAAELVRAA
jgi:hypothetical protein